MRLTSAFVICAVSAGALATLFPHESAAAQDRSESVALNLFTGRIDTTITLGAWLATNPGEIVSDSIPNWPPIEQVCRTTRSRVSIGGRSATRWAVFNIPNPPADETLPPASADFANRACALRAFWLVAEEPDSARARALASSLTLLIEARFGAGAPRSGIGGSGHARWLEPRAWSGPGTTVVLGVSPREHPVVTSEEAEVDTTRISSPRAVSILAYAPHGGFDDFGGPAYDRATAYLTEEEQWEKQWVLDKADSAIARVTNPSIAADLRLVLNRLRSNGYLDTVWTPAATALVRAARAIKLRAPTLDPRQRAALLLAGDLVLQRAAPAFDPSADTTKAHYRLYRELTTAGIQYGGQTYMFGYPYSRAWLWEAYRLDSLGAIGHLAFRELLAAGWKTTPECRENLDEIALTIEHGEAAMRRGNIDPLIAYYVGIAYQDRFSVARGNYYEGFATREHYEPKADEARMLGIERLRTSLLTLRERHLRRDAWRTAVRPMLGKTSQPRYFCFDD